jgi:hypothetical protein
MITEKMKKKIFDIEQNIEINAKKREESTTELTETIEKELNMLHAQVDLQKKMRE